MKPNGVIMSLLVWAILSGGLASGQDLTDPDYFLGCALIALVPEPALRDGFDPVVPREVEVQAVDGSGLPVGPAHALSLWRDRLIGFGSEHLQIAEAAPGGWLRVSDKTSLRARPLSEPERLGLRRYYTLDPYWVLQRLHAAGTEFDYYCLGQEICGGSIQGDNWGEGYYRRYRRVALAGEEERRFGTVNISAVVIQQYPGGECRLTRYFEEIRSESGRTLLFIENSYDYDENGEVTVTQTLSPSRQPQQLYAVRPAEGRRP